MSEVFVPSSQAVRKNKTNSRNKGSRKILQALQVSSIDESILVPSPIMLNRNGKKERNVMEQTFKIPEDKITVDKENTTTSRRSKRKNAALQDGCPKTCTDTAAKNPKLKPKTKRGQAKLMDKSEPTDVNQSKLDAYISVGSSSTSATNDASSKNSKLKPKSKRGPVKKAAQSESTDMNQVELDATTPMSSKSEETLETKEDGIEISTTDYAFTSCIIRSVSDENDLISDVASYDYWRKLAEQRRLALEQALYENAQLTDQLEVLETENGQLKSLLKEAESVVQLVQQFL